MILRPFRLALVLLCGSLLASPAFSQAPPNVTSVQISPLPVQSPRTSTVTINWDRPIGTNDPAYSLNLNTGGAPIPVGLPDGSISCTTSLIAILSPQPGSTSAT